MAKMVNFHGGSTAHRSPSDLEWEEHVGESTKRWWETVGGLMTGIAALITAVTGLIVAVYTLDRSENPSSSSVAPGPTATSTLSEPGRTADKAQGISAAPHTSVAARPVRPITLPENSKYVLGPEGLTARYELQSAVISTYTTEGDILRIHVRFTNLSENQNSRMNFGSKLFRLVIDEQSLRPKENFNYSVYSKKVREEDVLFLISKGVKQARLKIGNNVDGVDVPLDLGQGT